MQTAYTARTGSRVALAPGVSKTVLGVKAVAAHGLELCGFAIDFNGLVSTEPTVLVELCSASFATNPPGTNSTSLTVRQRRGKTLAGSDFATAARDWNNAGAPAEPTVLDAFWSFGMDPNKGFIVYDYPLGDFDDFVPGEGFAFRMTLGSTATQNVDVLAAAKIQRI